MGLKLLRRNLMPDISIKPDTSIIPDTSIMIFDEGFDRGIRCRYISEGYMVDSYVLREESLLSEIEKNMPEIVILDVEIFSRIDGIEISRIIRNLFNVTVLYR